MKKNTLLYTNLLVCAIITAGFIITSYIGYCSNTDIFQRDAEHVSTLATEGIYNQIDKILAEPISVSLTMANDSLLKNLLETESQNLNNTAYVQELRDYLYAYRDKYGYDSVFLVSAASNRYYHFEGLDRVLTPDFAENTWYYEFLDKEEEYALNIDNDEATDNSITAFVNCKIRDKNGNTMGVIGVGMKVSSLQVLLKEYEQKYGVTARLVDEQGFIQVSSDQTGYEQVNLFDDAMLAAYQDSILNKEARDPQILWYTHQDARGFVVTQYVPSLNWHLVVHNDMTAMDQQLSIQFFRGIAIIGGIILFVLIVITTVLKKYRAQIMLLGVSQKQEYQRLLYQATEGMYENIFEFDITHNLIGGESTKCYLETIGLTDSNSYDDALQTIVRRIKEEYQQGYLNTFSRENILEAYNQGITNLSYDLLTTKDGTTYHWMRINARIFFWDSDESVRIISYRTNIDQEKERERSLLETSRRDSMTGLYNKGTTEKLVEEILMRDQDAACAHAYIVFDIDDFKNINDKYGHTFGDTVIKEFAMEIQLQFLDSDIVGRIGGDEFSVLMLDCGSTTALCEKLDRCCKKIASKNFGGALGQNVSISIGAALFPIQGRTYAELFEKADEALYIAKAQGKNTYHVLGESAQAAENTRLDSRDIRNVLECTTDGIAKYAFTDTLKLLYFNKRLGRLVGSSREMVSADDFDPFSFVHPEDLAALQVKMQAALSDQSPIDVRFRLKRYDGSYTPMRLRGIFVNELYQNRYPVFYAVYTDLSTL